MEKLKAWLAVASNRSFVVAEITSLAVGIGSILDHSVSPYIALAPAVYGIVHLILPDFTLTPAQVTADAAAVEAAIKTAK